MSTLGPKDEARRQLMIRALASGLLGASLSPRDSLAAESKSGTSVLGDRPEQLPAGKSVFRIEGDATINGQPATEDSSILPGDSYTIETGPGSEIIFVVDSTAVFMREASRVVLNAGGSMGAAALDAIQLVTGKVLAAFVPGKSYSVDTTTAAIKIYGGGAYFEADSEQTYFCTCYGRSDVEARFDSTSKASIVSVHHDKPLTILADAAIGQHIQPAPFVGHTDQELMLIETLVGRTPSFVFPGSNYGGPRPGGPGGQNYRRRR